MFRGSDGPLLTKEAELSLLEAFGIVVASEPYQPLVMGQTVNACEYRVIQVEFVTGLMHSICTRIRQILEQSQLHRFGADFAEAVAHNIACLSCISKSSAKKRQPEVAAKLTEASEVVMVSLGKFSAFEVT